jgi:hypothetical protein
MHMWIFVVFIWTIWSKRKGSMPFWTGSNFLVHFLVVACPLSIIYDIYSLALFLPCLRSWSDELLSFCSQKFLVDARGGTRSHQTTGWVGSLPDAAKSLHPCRYCRRGQSYCSVEYMLVECTPWRWYGLIHPVALPRSLCLQINGPGGSDHNDTLGS